MRRTIIVAVALTTLLGFAGYPSAQRGPSGGMMGPGMMRP